MTHNQGKAANPQTAEGGWEANSFRLAIPCRTILFNIKRSYAAQKKLIAASSLIPLDKKAV
ncbi:hypothetical protein [Neisseria sp. HMSC31F04]|uniref:hypothetical protein n=1 Tax=Neisseria sp. HMSC31F04 TaxID=1581075 RepID=UPI00114D04D7|nr:hypothetical protein [Neisseria sp. HMSC31F04]